MPSTLPSPPSPGPCPEQVGRAAPAGGRQIPAAGMRRWIGGAGTAALALGLALGGLGARTVSPTGAQSPAQLVFSDLTAGGDTELFLARLDGTARGALTSAPEVIEAAPAWSPDGRLVAFSAHAGGNLWNLMLLDPDTGDLRAFSEGPMDLDPAWSPDGSRLAYASHFGVGGQVDVSALSVAPVEGLGARPILLLEDATRAIRHPTWSPDGGEIVFAVSSDSAGGELYRVGAEGASPRRLFAHAGWDDVDPAWSPDGRRIAFASGPVGGAGETLRHAIWLLDLASGIAGTIATDPIRDLRRPDWSPEGDQILFDAGMPGAARRAIHLVDAIGVGAIDEAITSGAEPAWRPPRGAAPSPSPTASASPTATGGATPTGMATPTPPGVPTLPVLPTLEPFPTSPPPEPTGTGPAPTFPRPSATPSATATPDPGDTPAPGSRAFLPITHNGSDATPTPSQEPTGTGEPGATSTPSPETTAMPSPIASVAGRAGGARGRPRPIHRRMEASP